MNKFKLGQDVRLDGTIKITGVQTTKNGTFVYNTSSASFPESELLRLEAKKTREVGKAAQPIAPQEDKPKFKVGDKVKVIGNGSPTNHYIKIGTIAKVTRASNAFNVAVEGISKSDGGTINQTISLPDVEPEQPKEPIKLYCVKDYINGSGDQWLKKGETYDVVHKGKYDYLIYKTWESMFSKFDFEEYSDNNPDIANCLVPLVKRTAKVGEWVYMAESTVHHNPALVIGEICKVVEVGDGTIGRYILTDKGNRFFDCAHMNEYLVLDNYQPEPEKEPEPVYLNMKVVCTKSTKCYHTVGVGYEIKDGFINYDGGSGAYNGKPITTLEEFNERQPDKFIPYLGEA